MHEGVGIERLRPALGRPEVPRGFEEGHEPRVVERQDRFRARARWESSIANPSSARRSFEDRFGTVRHVGRGTLYARLHGIRRNQALVLRAVDDLHDDGGLTGLDTVGQSTVRCQGSRGHVLGGQALEPRSPRPRPSQQQGGR